MQFRLRTLLLVTTATAVFLGVNSVLYQMMGAVSGIWPSVAFRSLFRLPQFLVWLVGALWVFERRARLRNPELVLLALGIAMSWHTVSEPLSMVIFTRIPPMQGTLGQLTLMGLTLASIAVDVVVWGLVLVAYARANERVEELSGPVSLVED